MSNVEEKKAFYKKWWFWVILVILVVAIIGMSGSNKNTTVVSQNNESKEVTSEKKVKVGESIQTDEVKISYKSSKEYTKYNTYSKPKSGNKVMRVEFEFENISNGDVVLDGLECYADGEKCEEYYYADDYKSPLMESLSKGKKVKAILYFEVPKSSKEIMLEYETNYWTDNKVEFVVQ